MPKLRAALLAAAAVGLSAAAAVAADTATGPSHVSVASDQSTVVRLDRSAKTVLVGNPQIAEAILVNDKTIYVQGRIFGNTNVIALDEAGAEILNTQVTVGAQTVAQVTVYRGPMGQRNLACATHCERVMTVGDQEFKIVSEHAKDKVEDAAKAAQLGGGGR
jgi:Flp pilus assembly secretin CpaC